MKKLMIVSVMLSMFLFVGCATVMGPYGESQEKRNERFRDESARAYWNNKFLDLYRNADLLEYVGKTTDDLESAFSTPDIRWTPGQGVGRLDVYGNGTVEYSPIGWDSVDHRIVFYMRKYKVYNAVKY